MNFRKIGQVLFGSGTPDAATAVEGERLPAQPAQPAQQRGNSPYLLDSVAPTPGVNGAEAQDGAEAPKTQFAQRFPGVRFTGTPDMSKIDPEVQIAPGATIEFPDPKDGAIALRGKTSLGPEAIISAPKNTVNGNVIRAGNITITGGDVFIGGSISVGSINGGTFINGVNITSQPYCLTIRDSEVMGKVSGLGDVIKSSIAAGASKSGNCALTKSKLALGASVDGNGDVTDSTLDVGAIKEGNGELVRSVLKARASVEGNGDVERSILEADARKSGNGDMTDSRLGEGAKRSGNGDMSSYDAKPGSRSGGNDDLDGNYTTRL